jgi:hypothetical protein
MEPDNGEESDIASPSPVPAAPNADEIWAAPQPAARQASLPGADFNTAQRRTRRGPSRLWVGLAIVFCAGLVAGILVFVTGGGASTGPAVQSAAFVKTAAQKTASEKTADISVSGSVTTAGVNVPIGGSGQIDFTNRTASFDIKVSVAGTSVTVKEILTRTEFYELVSGDILGNGQKWIETPIPQTPDGVALQDGGGDPSSMLATLSESGSTVKKIGTLEIGGVQTTEYSVVPSATRIASGIRAELSQPGLLAPEKQALEEALKSPPDLKLDVWIDASGLLRRMQENLGLSLSGSSAGGSGSFVFSFDNYGAPVDIAIPPPGDVTSISGVQSSIADSAAQSNLTNATTEAKALYQVDQEYASGAANTPYSAQSFKAQAPEFAWTQGACGVSPQDCISFEVFDVTAKGDSQGIALASRSASGTCWYAVDVETTPAAIPGDPSAIWNVTGGGSNSSLGAGVFFARSQQRKPQPSCSAGSVLRPSHVVDWGQSYAKAGSVG